MPALCLRWFAGYLSALVGYGPELGCTLLELRQQPAALGQEQQQQQQQQPQQAPAEPAQPRLSHFVLETPNLEAAAAHLQVRVKSFNAIPCFPRDPQNRLPSQ
jgi:hypothetical protein